MSVWSMRNPEGGPMPQTFGSRLDAADEARKEAKMWGPDDRDPVRCARCEGYDFPGVAHTLGCPHGEGDDA